MNKRLGNEPSPGEVSGSHAYGRVAKTHVPIPRTRRVGLERRGKIGGYRDSMVGSMAQYRSEPLPPMAKPDISETKPADAGGVIGNRPRSGGVDGPKSHGFTEPPRRGYDRFG